MSKKINLSAWFSLGGASVFLLQHVLVALCQWDILLSSCTSCHSKNFLGLSNLIKPVPCIHVYWYKLHLASYKRHQNKNGLNKQSVDIFLMYTKWKASSVQFVATEVLRDCGSFSLWYGCIGLAFWWSKSVHWISDITCVLKADNTGGRWERTKKPLV